MPFAVHDPAWSILNAPKGAQRCDFFWDTPSFMRESRNWAKIYWYTGISVANSCPWWWILIDLVLILPMEHRAVTKSPYTFLPKEGKNHWKSKFTDMVTRGRVSEFLVSKRVGSKTTHSTVNILLLSLWDIPTTVLLMQIHLTCLCFNQKFLNTLLCPTAEKQHL